MFQPRSMNPSPSTLGRQRGSVVVLVVVALVLMAVLAAAFLQVARSQRLTGARTTNNIDLVLNSVSDEIAAQLAADLFDGSGSLFGTGVEPYDAPWTNVLGATKQVTLLDGTDVPVAFGENDDAWLASTAPINDGGTIRWPQITSLTGVYLEADTNIAEPRFREVDPSTVASTFFPVDSTDAEGNYLNRNQDLQSTSLVDADGDTYGDSRWERAPIQVKDGIEYFMAVRIVDLSSMVNINTASAMTDDGVYDPANPPLGFDPSEIDIAQFLYSHNNDDSEVANSLSRKTQDASMPALTHIREGNWVDGSKQWTRDNSDISLDRYDNREEIYLRYRNGLTPPDGMSSASSNGQLEEDFPNTFRDPSPTTPEDWPYDINADYTDVNPEVYFGDDSLVTTNMLAGNSWYANPRLYLTTLSGASDYRPPYLDNGQGVGPLSDEQMKFPINDPGFFNDTLSPGVTNDLIDFLEDWYPSADTASWPGSTGGISDIEDFYAHFAASLQDYRDHDSRITTVTSRSGAICYGFENLPVISEVYVDRNYMAESSIDNGDGTYDVQWRAQNEANYVIELYNPYSTPLLLDDIHLQIVDEVTGNAIELGSDDISSISNVSTHLQAHNQTTPDGTQRPDFQLRAYVNPVTARSHCYLFPGERIQIYRESGTVRASDLIDDVDGKNCLSDNNGLQLWPNTNDATGEDGGMLEIRLLAEESDGTLIAQPYFTAPSKSMPDSFWQRGATNPYTNLEGYRQHVSVGNADGLSALTIDKNQFVIHQTSPSQFALAPQFRDDDIVSLGRSDKVADNSGPTGVIIQNNKQVMFSEPYLYNEGYGSIRQHNNRPWWIRSPAELGLITILPMQPGDTLPDAWQKADDPTDPDSMRLPLDRNSAIPDPSIVDSVDPNFNLPRALMLMESVSTESPMQDQLDNDGNGTSDETTPLEAFIPGRINLNTAPVSVLANALPIPGDFSGYRENEAPGDSLQTTGSNNRADPDHYLNRLARAIAAERQNPTRTFSTTYKPEGLTSVSELWNVLNDTSNTNATIASLPILSQDNYDNAFMDSTNMQLDPSGFDPERIGDGVVDDREEQLLILSRLQQYATVRSDVYVAYILVKGYESGNLANLVESGRMIVVYDRSGMREASDSVKILAKFKY